MNQVRDSNAQEQMIKTQIIDRGIRDERIVEAMRSIPRQMFFLEDAQNAAYLDRPSPIGHGQTISTPYIVALMSARLEIQPSNSVLEIGTGSGYQTAVLSKLAREVYTVERVKPLLDTAWERLMSIGQRNVHYRFGDGTLGWPEVAPFDRILITAGAPRVPEELLKSQLANGGIAVLPVGPADKQMLMQIRREGGELITKEICPCMFVKLIGKEGWSEGKESE